MTYPFSYLKPVCCSMSGFNYCFLTCIQTSQEAGQVVWYSHLFQNFPQFIVISLVKLVSNAKKEKRNPTKTPDLPQALRSPSLSSCHFKSFQGSSPRPTNPDAAPWDQMSSRFWITCILKRTMQGPILQGNLDLSPIIRHATYFWEEMYGLVLLRGMNTQYHFFSQPWVRF